MTLRRRERQMSLPMTTCFTPDMALRAAFDRAGLDKLGLHFSDVKGNQSAASVLQRLAEAYGQGDHRSASMYAGRLIRMRSRLCAGG